MNKDVKEKAEIETQASELLAGILNGDIERLSEQDKFLLNKNRKEIVEQLNALFTEEIPRILRGGECQDRGKLYWALQLAEFLKATESFPWIAKLCHLSIEVLDKNLGDFFVTEELAYLLSSTMTEWDVLKNTIENPDADKYVRSSCLEALVLSVVKKRIDRLDITDYFKILFHKIINGTLDDEILCTHLVCVCTDFWPGECLEEIREVFGLDLVDTAEIDIEFVLECFAKGKEYLTEKLQRRIEQHNFWEQPQIPPDSTDEFSQILDRMIKLSSQAKAESERTLKEVNKGSQRNDSCSCGSGRKYKKCCMNKSHEEFPSSVFIEKSVVSYGPLEESEEMKALPEEDKESILDLYPLLQENPEEVIQKIPKYLSKYPNIPMLYNYLYGAYLNTGHPREAFKIMHETVERFPDYLFGRVEYAHYLLRRGEPEKAFAVFESKSTLSQLYPERKIFHAAEWVAFAYVIGLYWIQKGNISQAKIYVGMIQQISPNSVQLIDLRKKMKSKLYLQSMERLKEGV